MEIIYESGQIIDVRIANEPLNSKLTHDERMTFFGCAEPNATVWASVESVERGKASIPEAATVMVSEGLITQQRADEISA